MFRDLVLLQGLGLKVLLIVDFLRGSVLGAIVRWGRFACFGANRSYAWIDIPGTACLNSIITLLVCRNGQNLFERFLHAVRIMVFETLFLEMSA